MKILVVQGRNKNQNGKIIDLGEVSIWGGDFKTVSPVTVNGTLYNVIVRSNGKSARLIRVDNPVKGGSHFDEIEIIEK